MGLKFQPLLFSGFVSSSGSGSSPTIGGPVVGGTDGSVLFVHPTGIMAQDNSNFNFNDTTHQLTITGNLQAATFNGYTPENLANKGVANGYAPLDSAAKIPVAFLPSVVMEYQGAWNPSTNSPALSDGTGTNGFVYYVSAAFAGPIAGLTDPSMHNFQIGDIVIYSSSIGKWQLTTPAAGVQSVNGLQGVVVLTQGNLSDSSAGADGITVTGGSNAVWGAGTSFAQQKSDATHNGYLSSTDWSTFNNKQNALTIGNLTDVGTDGITITGGSGAVIGSGTSISQHVADATHNGYLASTDWNTFNNKQPAGNYANTNLSNLASPTAINQNLISASSNTYQIGTAANVWTDMYSTAFHISDGSNTYGNFQLNGTTPSGNNTKAIISFPQNSGPAAVVTSNNATSSILYIETGNASAGNSGDLSLKTGTATGTRGNITLDGNIINLNAATSISANSKLIRNVANPLLAQDAATKSYVDGLATGGTVTSVALAAPAFLTVSGSPVTTSGTLTLTLASQSANTVFAAPNGSSGAPTFRALVAADVPFASLASAGDLNETSFTAAASQTNQPVTGFTFANGVVRSFRALASVSTNGSTYAEFELSGIQKSASWEMAYNSVGDSTGYTFTINSSGQVLYTSGANTATIKFRAITTTV